MVRDSEREKEAKNGTSRMLLCVCVSERERKKESCSKTKPYLFQIFCSLVFQTNGFFCYPAVPKEKLNTIIKIFNLFLTTK